MADLDRNFASDNVAGVAPAVLDSLRRANEGSTASYGEDPWSARLTERMSVLFERPVAVFPVATGTAANALALAALTPPYGAIYSCEDSHVARDECAAPEFYSGAKVIGVPAAGGKLCAAALREAVAAAGAFGVHHVKPATVSLTQATEWGTVYRPGELADLCSAARGAGLRVHVDGARFANAVAALGCRPADLTWRIGVDTLAFGATKNGALAAEAVVVFDTGLAESISYRRMRGGHLWSKSRFLAAQWLGYLGDDSWLALAAHANGMARALADGLCEIAGVSLVQPTEANEVFVHLPDAVDARLRAAGFIYHRWPTRAPGARAVFRLVTSFATRPDAVRELVRAARGPREHARD